MTQSYFYKIDTSSPESDHAWLGALSNAIGETITDILISGSPWPIKFVVGTVVGAGTNKFRIRKNRNG